MVSNKLSKLDMNEKRPKNSLSEGKIDKSSFK